MENMEENYAQMQLMSQAIQLQLLKGEVKWEDEVVQFFLPAVLYLTDFDWLNIIAENILVEEDEEIVKNFLAKAQSLIEVNGNSLNEAVSDKLKGMFK